MKPTKNIGMLLLAIWLVLVGLSGLLGFNLGQLAFITPVLALAAAGFIFVGR
jgi:hypothetical protein